jgi:hypothetical protein
VSFVARTLSGADKVDLKDIMPKEEHLGRNDGQNLIGPPQQRQRSEQGLTEPEEVFENASLNGIAEVFNQQMCTSIRQVNTQGELKAAVTMVFPNWGLVGCLMSLEVGAWNVEWLAMILFEAKVSWVNGVLQVTHGGITLIITNSEATLKGAVDDASDKIFLPGLNAAVTASGISMTVLKHGAIINLALSVDKALKMQQKLYT